MKLQLINFEPAHELSYKNFANNLYIFEIKSEAKLFCEVSYSN